MDTRTLKVFLSCALGGAVGAVIALTMHPYFWWVGLISGGVVGYFSYEFRQVRLAIKEALEVAWNTVRSRRIGAVLLVSIAVASTIASLCYSLYATGLFTRANSDAFTWVFAWSYGGAMLMVVSFAFAGSYAFYAPRPRVKSLAVAALALTPLGLPVVVAGGSIYGLFWAVAKSPKAVKFCAVFTKTLFKLIHSDVRLLCGVDAAIGAGIGWYFNSPIIGALAGGAIGVANFEILSRRVLHLVKSR